MLIPLKKCDSGFSLVELLISLVIGLIIVATGIAIFINTAATDFYQLKVTRINQELRGVINLISRDVRRIGYIGPSGLAPLIGTATWNPFISDASSNFLFVLQDVNNFDGDATTYDCILFAIDDNTDGVDDGNSERFGYRLAPVTAGSHINAIKMRQSGSACTTNNWESITDDNIINITSLTFKPSLQRVGTNSNLIICTIEISITGTLISEPTVQRTVNQSVKLRNDIYDPTGTNTSLCQ